MIKPFIRKWPFLLKLRFFLALALILIVFCFLWLKVVPFGHISYTRDYSSKFGSGKGFIYGLTPAERVDLKSGEAPLMIGDPVYFSVFTPRTFDEAKMTIVYRDNLGLDTPLIEAGVLADNIVWRYDLQPLDNKALDYLGLRWNKIEEDGVLFLQKDKNYSSLSDFENDLARGKLIGCDSVQQDCLAVYNYSPSYQYQIANYQPALPLVLGRPLRGAHQFYVYVNNEPLRLDFSFIDLNQDAKPAPINIILSRSGQVIDSKYIADENLRPASGEAEEKTAAINQMSLKPGVYKVEVKISDDVVIKKIVSSVDRLSFINKIWPVSNDGPLTLYTDSDNLQLKAMGPGSLQTIVFGSKKFALDEAYKQFDFTAPEGTKIKEIKFPKDDIVLENNGVFAWSPNSLFNPSLAKVDRYFSVHDSVKYIVSRYAPPREEDGYKTATLNFDLKGAYRENGKYSFMISVPGLKTEDGTKDNLEIYEIKIELNGRTLWQKIWR